MQLSGCGGQGSFDTVVPPTGDSKSRTSFTSQTLSWRQTNAPHFIRKRLTQNSPKTLTLPPRRVTLLPRCGAKTRTGTPCHRKSLANGRCRNHGGLSSGPKSTEGRERIADAQRWRWERWRSQRSVTESSEGPVRKDACLAYATAGTVSHAEAASTPIPGDRHQVGSKV